MECIITKTFYKDCGCIFTHKKIIISFANRVAKKINDEAADYLYKWSYSCIKIKLISDSYSVRWASSIIIKEWSHVPLYIAHKRDKKLWDSVKLSDSHIRDHICKREELCAYDVSVWNVIDTIQ